MNNQSWTDRVQSQLVANIPKYERHRTQRHFVSGALAIALVGGLALNIIGNDESTKVQIARPAPAASASTVLFLEPSTLPNDLQLRTASGGDDPGKEAFANGDAPAQRPGTAQLWANINERGETTATFLLDSFALSDKEIHDDRLGIEVQVRGHVGRYDARSGLLLWQETKSGALGLVFGPGMPSHGATFSLDDALAIANDIVTVNGSWKISTPPLGFELLAHKARQHSLGTNPRVLSYSALSRGVVAHISDNSQVPALWYLAFPGARRVSIHENDAVWVPIPGGAGEQVDTILTRPADSMLIWNETDRGQVRAFGARLTQAELTAFAQSLRPISTNRWIQLVNSTGGTFVHHQPTTTTTSRRRTDPSLLQNTTWKLQYVDNPNGRHETIGPKPTMQFTSSEVLFHGCNYLSAEIAIGDGHIHTPGVFKTTLVLCKAEPTRSDAPVDREESDAIFRHVFGDTEKQRLSTWFIDSLGLHVSDAAGHVHMLFD